MSITPRITQDENKILFSITIILIFSITIPANADIESPKKQLKKGIPIDDIICKKGLDFIIRNNGAPACVKPATAERFQSLGLAVIPIKITDVGNKTEQSQLEKDTSVKFKDAQNGKK